MANGKLPFAASNTNGTASTQNIGYLPYQTIGALQKDSYGNTFYYAVNNKSLNISINGSSASSMSLTSTNTIQNFCGVLYALNYYYSQNPTPAVSDVRTINAPNGTPTPDAFILISSGANNKLDSTNTITNSNGTFASEQYPLSTTYDDNVLSLSITNAIGKFCSNSPNTQFSATYTNGIYQVTSLEFSNSSNSTNTGNNPPGNSAYGKCVSNCNQNWWCGFEALLSYGGGGCNAACNASTSFCQ